MALPKEYLKQLNIYVLTKQVNELKKQIEDVEKVLELMYFTVVLAENELASMKTPSTGRK